MSPLPLPPAPQTPPGADRLISLWQSNAAAWSDAVRSGAIESRRLATDAAVLEAVLAHRPPRVLDVGCGEGWLARALAQHGVGVTGIDPVEALIERAQGAGGGRFEVASIADLMHSPLAEDAPLWVCNFSLFHEHDAPALIAAAAQRLPALGLLVIQTLHETAVPPGTGEGWQPGGWGAFGPAFGEAIPWYFRRPDGWRALLARHGFANVQMKEPAHPISKQPLSLLITASR